MRFEEGLLRTSYATETFWKAYVASGLPGNLLSASENETLLTVITGSRNILWVASPASRKIGASDGHLVYCLRPTATENVIQVVAGKNLEHFWGVKSTITARGGF